MIGPVAVRAVSTGWHFLPVGSWTAQLSLALVQRMDLPLWPVILGWVVLGLAAPAALALTAQRQRIPLRLQRSWAARRLLTQEERRTSYSAFALALNATRGTAAVALVLGLYAVLGGAQSVHGTMWTFLLGVFTVLLSAVGLSPLFNGLRLLKISGRTDPPGDAHCGCCSRIAGAAAPATVEEHAQSRAAAPTA